jgi:hypothetical protein
VRGHGQGPRRLALSSTETAAILRSAKENTMGITQKQIVYQYHRDHTTPNG